MKIVVDADSCPVKEIITEEAKKRSIDIVMICDASHIIDDGYSKVVTVDIGPDNADMVLINMVEPVDIVVSQDMGVCAMALGKKARVITPWGTIVDENNIDRFLFERFLGSKSRRAGIRTKGPKKRSKDEDVNFKQNFIKMLENSSVDI